MLVDLGIKNEYKYMYCTISQLHNKAGQILYINIKLSDFGRITDYLMCLEVYRLSPDNREKQGRLDFNMPIPSGEKPLAEVLGRGVFSSAH